MASPPENRRNYCEKSSYDRCRILPADFPETKTSVRNAVFEMFGGGEISRAKPTLPAWDSVRLGGVRQVRERPSPEPMTDLSERRSLGVG